MTRFRTTAEPVIRRVLAFGLTAVLVAAVGAGASAGSREGAAARGAEYIAERQESSGTFFSPDTDSDTTAEAVLALVAGGITGDPVDRAFEHIREHGPDSADERAGSAGRIALGVAAGAGDPRDFGGVDYSERIRGHYDETTGGYDTNLYANALALLGLAASRVEPPPEAIRYVRANQCADGGFSWAPGCAGAPDVDTTAHTLSALLAAGVPSDDLMVSRARDWLVRARNDEGGFGYTIGEPTNGNSTGVALSAIAALGEDPADAPWADERGNPVDVLLSLQTASGGFKYLGSDDGPNDYTTVQAVPGAAGAAYPLFPGSEEETPSSSTTPEASPDPTSTPEDRDDDAPTPSPSTAPTTHDDEAPDEESPSPQPAPTSPTPGRTPADTFGSGEHRAGLLVRGEDGEVRRMCVLFDDPETDGLTLLERAGLDTRLERFEGQGTSVCRIGPDGCSDDCFCEYPTFWGYWVRDPGDDGWRLSELGAERRTVTDGSMDAWVWGPDGGDAPPALDVDDVCPAAAEAGAVSAATPRPTPEPAEDGPVNVPAMAGVGALLVGSGVALGVRRWRAG